MSFQPSNITSFKDLDNKYREQIALLRIQAQNDERFMEALKGKEQGVIPTMEPFVSTAERLKDDNFQRSQALKNLKELFDEPIEASKALNALGIDEIKSLNRLFPFIRSDFGSKYSNFDADFFLDYLEKLVRTVESQKGYINQYMPASIEDDNEEIREDSAAAAEGGVFSYWDLNDLKKYKIPKKYKDSINKKIGSRTIEKYLVELEELIGELDRKTNPVVTSRVDIGDNNRKPYLINQQRINRELDKYYAIYSQILFVMTGHMTGQMEQSEGVRKKINKKMETEEEIIGEEGIVDEEEETKEEIIPDTGAGMRRYGKYIKGRVNARVIMGRGIALEAPIPNNSEFGKFMINQNQLRNNILNIKYHSGGPVPQIKKMNISDNLKNFMFDLLETQEINQSLYRKLNNDDKKLFRKLVTLAQLNKKLGVKDIREDDEEDVKRYELVKGQFLAGNNADSVKHELVKLIYKFSLGGKISTQDAEEIILSLLK